MALYSALTRAMNWSAVSLDWVVPVAGASAGDGSFWQAASVSAAALTARASRSGRWFTGTSLGGDRPAKASEAPGAPQGAGQQGAGRSSVSTTASAATSTATSTAKVWRPCYVGRVGVGGCAWEQQRLETNPQPKPLSLLDYPPTDSVGGEAGHTVAGPSGAMDGARRAPMGESALLARHCLACVRTHSRQRLGRAAERGLRRVPPRYGLPRPKRKSE
ncbi:hypothetical protein D3C71_1420790 [compost metagenome]